MKKLTKVLVIMLAFVLILGGCGSKDSEEAGSDETPYYSVGINEDGFFEGITAKDYVKLGEYMGLEIPEASITVTEEDVLATINDIFSSHGTAIEVTDRAAELGDTVNIDYAGYMGKDQFEGGTAEAQPLTLGSGSFIDDFEEQIVGHMPGDEFDVEVTFPDPYQNNPDFAGKDAVFKVKLNFISDTEYPTADDAEFISTTIKEEYGWGTYDEMLEGVKANLIDNLKYNYVSDVISGYEVSEIPESMYNYQLNSMKSYYENYAQMFGVSLDEFVQTYVGAESFDAIVETYKDDLNESAKYCLVMQALAEDMGLKMSEDDVKAYFADNLGTEDYSEYETYYGMPYVKNMVMSVNAIQNIIENSVVVK